MAKVGPFTPLSFVSIHGPFKQPCLALWESRLLPAQTASSVPPPRLLAQALKMHEEAEKPVQGRAPPPTQ
eukprot:4179146-Pleurochrysis_carterae.AAC.3